VVAVSAEHTATVAAPSVVSQKDIMAAYHVSVLAYNDSRRPALKFQVRIRGADKTIKRRFFETRAEAEAEKTAVLVEVENVGIEALNIDPRTRLEVISALGKLKPFEVSITHAIDFFVDHHRANCSVKEACGLYLASRKSATWSKLHLRNLRSIIHRFVETFGDRSISVVRVEDIEKWFDALHVAPVSINSYRGLLNAVFAFAKKRKLSKVNPFEDIDVLPVTKDKAGILTPDQMSALLDAASGEADVLVTLALGAFAGLRPEEVSRMRCPTSILTTDRLTVRRKSPKPPSSVTLKLNPF
jgi:hypothetical protein